MNIDEYHSIKKWLSSFEPKLSGRSDRGVTQFNLRDCAYMDDFSQPKIMFQEMVQESSFFLDINENFFCNDTGRIILGKNLELLLAVLNSKLFFFAIKNFYGGGSLGTKAVRMKHTFFHRFPCIIFDEMEQPMIKKMVQEAHQKPNSEILEQLDKIVFDAYNLTNEEQAFILAE